MSRAERRRLAKEQMKQTKTFVMTEKELSKHTQKAIVEAVDISLNLMLGIPLLAMRDLSTWSNGTD